MNHRILAASLAASLAAAASAMAASAPAAEPARIVSEYAAWAGGHDNAGALVAGLHNGSPITIATTSADHHVSLAGFTPNSTMSYGNVSAALAHARSELARLGVRHPSAEQIQAALIGGELELGGRTREVRGTIAVRGGNPQLATR
jgi:hypothetical protein